MMATVMGCGDSGIDVGGGGYGGWGGGSGGGGGSDDNFDGGQCDQGDLRNANEKQS